MWPLISSFRISSACAAASSGVSANLTPPAFIRPPVKTWLLMTTGPPMSSATLRASSAVVQNPYCVTGIPANSTIFRASYSKNLIAARNPIQTAARAGGVGEGAEDEQRLAHRAPPPRPDPPALPPGLESCPQGELLRASRCGGCSSRGGTLRRRLRRHRGRRDGDGRRPHRIPRKVPARRREVGRLPVRSVGRSGADHQVRRDAAGRRPQGL